MSKKLRRSRHRIAPVPWATPRPVVLSEEYEREVERSTSRLEREYARAQKRVRQAEARLAKAKLTARTATTKVKAHVIAELEAALQARRDELEEYRRMMVSVPASANHRGTKSYRPVPVERPGS